MVATTMANKAEKSDKPERDPNEITTLKVRRRAASLVGKAAKLRGQNVEELFASREVEDFFSHLIVAEAKKVESHLNDRR